jgi:hypothetical protein
MPYVRSWRVPTNSPLQPQTLIHLRPPQPCPQPSAASLGVVRKLIDYGKQLASTVQQRATAPGFARFAARFGTADVAAILTCITNGLLHAAALEAKLCQRAECGRDLTPPPVRLPSIRASQPARQVEPPSA